MDLPEGRGGAGLGNREFVEESAKRERSVGYNFAKIVGIFFRDDAGAFVQKMKGTTFTQRQAEFLPANGIEVDFLIDFLQQGINTSAGMSRNYDGFGVVLPGCFPSRR